MSVAESTSPSDVLIQDLYAIAGEDHVLIDEEDRLFYSMDVYNQAKEPAVAVVRPATQDALIGFVKVCHRHKAPMIARGGGLSYTDGYLPVEPNSVVFDTSQLNAIVEINEDDMYVTVESGVTWSQLHEALSAKGLRTPFWGPFSGIMATVGGSMSQNAVNFGTGLYGVSAESVIAMEIVLANGKVLKTGSAASAHGVPFFRHNGPDLVGLFTGDTGALGIKARITLRLIAKEDAYVSASFAFDTFDKMADAMVEIGKLGIVSEQFGMDPLLQKGALARMATTALIPAIKSVLKSSRGPFDGILQVIKMGLAGRSFLKKANYLSHFTTEGVNKTEAKIKLAVVRKIAARYGVEVANSVPVMIRAEPFMPPTPMVGPTGQRWKPTHGILPFSRIKEFNKAFEELRSEYADRLRQNNIYITRMFMVSGTNAFLFEPTFVWEDKLTLFHHRVLSKDFLDTLITYDDNPQGREVVAEVKAKLIDLFHEFGSSHLQIGKDYPYLKGRDPQAVYLLKELKKTLDPDNLMNPGSLGL